MRKPSSVLSYEELDTLGDISKFLSDIYYMIPFLVELRCLIDFTFHKTSLDMFQTMALFSYHYEIYSARIGNMWYVTKILGSPVEPMDKFIFGWFMTGIILTLVVGPLILFSDLMPGLVGFNPVLSSDVRVFISMNQTRYSDFQGSILTNDYLREID